jgi:hypothetical protein
LGGARKVSTMARDKSANDPEQRGRDQP